ncbi:coproporphyrinogen dehydrogenase HemZ [Sedimentibacter sp. zth1]|uniref:coproporphyrinogen dehydrogenase HemZ n=1 Tax=Sedimentibacter sp. zth1 TaxID=2816908 RepID=UPI001A910CD5|nr:coproporphyrinogen dehydrogenase HemZ [Sedimentibacter sp. zth1]QSX06336.1 coproporphyrinogen dehydrogenase HemZ [Sedimentibacter sp. zth1]
MIKFYLIGHEFEYEVRNVFRIFDLNSDIELNYVSTNSIKLSNFKDDLLTVYSELIEKNGSFYGSARLFKGNTLINERTINSDDIIIEKADEKKLKKTIVKKSLYYILSKFYDIKAEYGFLTGIRPNKILTLAISNGFSDEEAKAILRNTYEVNEEKIELLYNIYLIQKKYIAKEENLKNYNLYIGIPFCPTKCIYCSFVSFTKYDKHEVDKYVQTLKVEIEETIKLAIRSGLALNTIYFGGGTPSVLSCENIDDIFGIIRKYYDIDKVKEITFEAGRPDTITEELLSCIKKNGVNRISINPQTMNDNTLKAISRRHTVQNIIDVYNLARTYDFDSINMDLIIGLPGECADDVNNSIERVIDLKPDNITIHALAYKKGSKLFNSTKNLSKDYDMVESMYHITKENCINSNYIPYYMYRQKNIKANLENVGYCINGKESIYNIVIIEEIETILACGAGAVSKILKGNNRHERVQNYKNLEDYNENIQKNIKEKEIILFS